MPKKTIGAHQPRQELYQDEHGTVRFRENALVRHLLDNGGLTMNDLAVLDDVPIADHEQFAQLIGYSLGGFSELSYVTDKTFYAAEKTSRFDVLAPMPSPEAIEKILREQLDNYPSPKKAYRKWTDTLSSICGDTERRPWTSVLSTMPAPYSAAVIGAWAAALQYAHHSEMALTDRDRIEVALLDQAQRDDRLLDLWVACIEKNGAHSANSEVRDHIEQGLQNYAPSMYAALRPMVSTVAISWTDAISLHRQQTTALDLPAITGSPAP
jgi:hypothetical protein